MDVLIQVRQVFLFLAMWFWWIVGGSLLAMVLLYSLGALLRRPHPSSSSGWGSARWARRSDVARAGLLSGDGAVLGQFGREILRASGERHVLLVSPTRWGKGVNTIIPTLLTWPDSLICLDIKNENYDTTASYRQTLGPVYRFNPTDTSAASINLLDNLRWNTVHELTDVTRLAESLCSPQMKADERTEYYRDAAVDVLTTVFLWLSHQTQFPMSPGGAWDFFGLPLTQALRHLEASTDPEVTRGVSVLLATTPARRAELWMAARRKLDVWRDRLVCFATAKTDIPWQEIQTSVQPMSIYLQVSAADLRDRLRQLFRVLLEVIGHRLMDRPLYPAPPRRVLLVLDEFAQMGYLPIIEQFISLMAGYRIYLLLVLQSISQLWEQYGEHTGILDNCDVWVFGTPNSVVSAEVFERLLGTSTVTEASQRWGGHRFSPVYEQHAETVNRHARPLRTAAEILESSPEDVFVRVSGCPPILARKLRYYTDARFLARVP